MSCPVGTRIEGVPHFDVTITNSNVDDVAKIIIKHIKKEWDVNNLSRQDFDTEFTNTLCGFFLKPKLINGSTNNSPDKDDVILFRMYGPKTELIINRAQELRNNEEMARNEIIKPLYCTFANGYCYKLTEGKQCTPETFLDKEMLSHSAKFLALLHTANLSDNYIKHHKMESKLFETIKHYINLMPKRFDDAEKQERFENNVPSADKLLFEVDVLQNALSNLPEFTVSFCHNDLLLSNIIFDREGALHCLDYEYAGPNYSAYDIANHFNELCGLDGDYSLYPTKETQMWWLRMYLERVNDLNGSHAIVEEEEVEGLYQQVEHMSLVSHLLWAIWAQVQAFYSINDFDFIAYGISRLKEYFKRKEQVLDKYMNELIKE